MFKPCVFMFKLCISLEKILSSAVDTCMSTLFLPVSENNHRTVTAFTAELFKLQMSDMSCVYRGASATKATQQLFSAL